ncbi:excalibur calcium-binding protein [Streptomyces sp. NPDC050287]|uniref:excalibur calcium-binding protein n=1 Tax=Streptomyces sp. NPDC050287 TaxID=3365608 RepID=UPI0037914E08
MRRRTAVAGTLIAIAATAPLAATAHAQDLRCRDFTFQEDAQAALDTNPDDQNRLDEDQGPADGIACEALPRRDSPVTSSTSRPFSSATPTAVTPTRGVQGGLGGASASGPTGLEMGIGSAFVAGGVLATGYAVRRRRS